MLVFETTLKTVPAKSQTSEKLTANELPQITLLPQVSNAGASKGTTQNLS